MADPDDGAAPPLVTGDDIRALNASPPAAFFVSPEAALEAFVEEGLAFVAE